MEDTTNRPVAVGKVARVELCACAGSVVLSLGAVSLRLDLATAADVAATLDFALSLAEREQARAAPRASDNQGDGLSKDPN